MQVQGCPCHPAGKCCPGHANHCAGAFGTVYRATLDEVDKVAVKLMQPGLDMEKLRDSFVNEVSFAELRTSSSSKTLNVLVSSDITLQSVMCVAML